MKKRGRKIKIKENKEKYNYNTSIIENDEMRKQVFIKELKDIK